LSLLELLAWEQRAGLRPVVVLPRRGTLVAEMKRMDIRHFVVPSFQWVEWAEQPRWRRPAVRIVKATANSLAEVAMLAVVRMVAPDVLHINSSAIGVGARAARFWRVPTVWHIREFNSPESGRVFSSPRRMRQLISRSQVVIAVSNAVARDYRAIVPDKRMQIIYDAVTSPVTPRDIDAMTSSVIQIAVVGSVVPAKNQLEAVEALSRLPGRSGHRVHLTLLGPLVDKTYERRIRKAVQDHGLTGNVDLAGRTDEVYDHLRRTDILVVASRSESFGRVTVEAMLSRCLVIGAANTGTKELLSEGRGVLYAGGADGLAAAICQAIEDPEQAKATAHRGFQYAVDISDPTKCAESLVRVIKEASE
jgi:glycosyltransferase involved in cell wall biosynthesis